jgi:uracil-DNA glycosylase
MDIASLPVHDSWLPLLSNHRAKISKVLKSLEGDDFEPPLEKIWRACEQDLNRIRVVIIGQDPYPTRNFADGLAFSTAKEVEKRPASLRNIFKELKGDLGLPTPSSGDLSPWSERGVLLLNRVLTTRVGKSDAHGDLGWQEITDAIAAELGARNTVAILWGAKAQELRDFFPERIESVHPSPLSAYRGFFGSKPFSRTNAILLNRKEAVIDWSLP